MIIVEQKKKVMADKRTTWCVLQDKRMESFKLDLSSTFKTYIFVFANQYGHEFEIIVEEKKRFHSLEKGQSGYLTHGMERFIDFQPSA